MKRNMSNVDRSIRIFIAALFAYLYFAGLVSGTFGIVLLAVGAVFVLTGIVSFCPLYALVNFSTHKS